MALDLSSLVRSASGALLAKDARQRQQEALRNQRMMQVLQHGLLAAQIGNYRSQIETRAKEKAPAPRFTPITDPVTGEVSGYDPSANTLTPSGGRVHPKPVLGGVLEQKATAGAGTALESIDDAERLLAANPEADVLPLGAALARGAKTSGGLMGTLGGIAEPLAQRSMTPDQQQFQADMQRMVHSMVGLLPGSRQSIVLFNSLVNAYTPLPNESAQTRTAKRAARQRARAWLAAIAAGKPVPVPPELAAAGITDADITPSPTTTSPAPAPSPRTPGYNPRFWNPQ